MKKNCTIQFLMLIFSILIVLYHTILFYPAERLTSVPFFGGYIAFDFFFIIAGYYMMISFENRNHNMSLQRDTFGFILDSLKLITPEIYVELIISLCIMNCWKCDNTLIANNMTSKMPWAALLVSEAGIGNQEHLYWCISAILFALMIIYPLRRKLTNSFYLVAVPVSLFGLGFLYQKIGNLKATHTWFTGIFMGGFIRGFVGILFGCICYRAAKYLKQYTFTKAVRVLFTIVEWAIYLFILVFVYGHGNENVYARTNGDFILYFLMLAAVTITLSNVSYDENVFSGKVYKFIAKLAFVMYISQDSWIGYFVYMQMEPVKKVPLFIIVVISNAMVVIAVSELIRFVWSNNKDKIKKLIIQE